MGQEKMPSSTWGRTITIKHFLLKKGVFTASFRGNSKGSRITSMTSAMKYPLYVFINVKRQPTQFRSMLEVYLPEEDLEQFLVNHSEELEYEKRLITAAILLAKPFDSQDFSLSDALKIYTKMAQKFDIIIANHLRILLNNVLWNDIHSTTLAEDLALPPSWLDHGWDTGEIQSNGLTAAHNRYIEAGFGYGLFPKDHGFKDYSLGLWVNYLKTHIGPVDDLYKEYQPAIWNIERYCSLVNAYGNIGFLSIDKWYNGVFDEAFLRCYRSQETLTQLKDGVEKLIASNSDLSAIIPIMK